MQARGTRDERVFAAIGSIREFMNENLAASKIELEAKLVDSYFSNPPFEPHHVHNATQYLIRSGEITRTLETTRGGRRPPVFVTNARDGRNRRVEDAAARKRLLMSRYYSFVEGGEESSSSLAGPAGELAFQNAFIRSSVGAGLATITRERPSVPMILGAAVPMGPLDNAFVLSPLDRVTLAPVPPWGVQALVEVKNIREWIYPRTQELYQVLYKAAQIQRANPSASLLPILVCRRAHVTTRFMAKDLGFFIIEARRQFLPDSSLIDPSALLEMTAELGISDLVQGTDPAHTTRIEKGLLTLQRVFDVQKSIDRWKHFTSDDEIVDAFGSLVLDKLPNKERDRIASDLRDRAHQIGATLGW
jgi:hypothetical protein